MTLRDIHDFELDLLEPCVEMTWRGLRVDEAKRVAMRDDLLAARAPLEAAVIEHVTQRILPAFVERINGGAQAHLFRERRVCACCRNGKKKRAACWTCAGLTKAPSKPDMLVGPCAKCAGAGASEVATFNPHSPAQLKVVLYDLLKLPARVKDGKPSTDEEALKSLLAECERKPEARRLIEQLLRVGKLETIGGVLERITPGEDERIRTVYNPAGTETGRFTSSESFLVKSTNLSNLPKREATEPRFDVRACIVPDDGCVFVEADYSGAEAWVTAACCGDHALLKVLQNGTKLHRWTAANALHKPESEVTDQEYALYKTARHALNYGMQWATFLRNVNAVADRTGIAITAKQAKATCVAYHALHPKLAEWWQNTQGTLVRDGVLTTCFGRTRRFYGRNRGEYLGETHREAIAFEPQSTIADLLNRGLLRWWRQHDGRSGLGILLAQVYDSVLIQAPKRSATTTADLVRRCLTEEIEVHGTRITIPVDVKILTSWAVQ